MEHRTIEAHRYYLAALMRVEALDEADDASAGERERLDAEATHLRTFVILNLFLNELGYVPKGLATRSDLAMALACEVGQSEAARQFDLAARALAQAEGRIRSA